MPWALVNAGSQQSGTSGAITTAPANATGANWNFIATADISTSTQNPPTDNQGTAAYVVVATKTNATSLVRTTLWKGYNAGFASGLTISYGTGTCFPALAFLLALGDATSAVDQTSSSEAASASSIQPGGLTPASSGCLVLNAVGFSPPAVDPMTNNQLTIYSHQAGAGGLSYGVMLAAEIQTTPTARNPTSTVATGTGDLAAVLASMFFTPPAGGAKSLAWWNTYGRMANL
jgi:hypothetical protein